MAEITILFMFVVFVLAITGAWQTFFKRKPCQHSPERLVVVEKIKLMETTPDGLHDDYLCRCACRDCGEDVYYRFAFTTDKYWEPLGGRPTSLQ